MLAVEKFLSDRKSNEVAERIHDAHERGDLVCILRVMCFPHSKTIRNFWRQ